jgi:hypothetical protein
MSIEQAIHLRWKTCRPLTDLVASDRFFTRAVPASATLLESARQPYVTLQRLRSRRESRLSDGKRLSATLLRFHIWSLTLEQAKRVAREVQACFDREEFSLAGILVQDMKLTDQRETLEGDHVWHLSLDYLTRTELED